MRRRAHSGNLAGAAGALAVLVAAFLPWYRFTSPGTSGTAVSQVARDERLATAASFWKAWGPLPNVLLVVLVAGVVAALAASAAAPRERGPAAVALACAVALLGLVLAWVLRIPGPDELVARGAGGWLALAGAGVAVIGAFAALDAAQHEPGADPV